MTISKSILARRVFCCQQIVDGLSTLRADADDEVTGLDQVEHGERGYTIGLFTGSPTMFGMLESENETAISSTPKNGVI